MSSILKKESSLINHVFIGDDPEILWEKAKEKANLAFERYPHLFNADKPFIDYSLMYVPPYEKDFKELMILQAKAVKTAPFCHEFHGYVILGLSKWLSHESEDYLDIAMKFWKDMSDEWAYIFIICAPSHKNLENMLETIANYFSDTSCSYEAFWAGESLRSEIDWILASNNAACSERVKQFSESVLTNRLLSKKQLRIILKELSSHTKIIRVSSVRKYLEMPNTFLSMVCTTEQLDEIASSLKTEGEHDYETSV